MFLADVFSQRSFFGWCLLQKFVFWMKSSPRSRFWMMSSPRSRFWMMSSPGSRLFDDVFSKKLFLKKCFLENHFFEMFGKCLEKSSNSRSKNRGQKSGGQIPAEKGLAKKPSQVLQKIDTNFKTTTRRRKRRRPKTGRRAKARRPVFGLLFWNLNRFFEGLGLAFWLSFFVGWILCWPMLWDGFFLGILAHRKNCFQKAAQKTVFPNSSPQKPFSEKAPPKNTFSPNLLFLNLFFDGLKRIPTKNDAEPYRN